MPNIERITAIEKKLNSIDKKEIQNLKKSYKLQETKVARLTTENQTLKKTQKLQENHTAKLTNENNSLKIQIRSFEKEKNNLQKIIDKKELDLKKFEELKRIKPLYQNDFNDFIANSVKALQNNLESDDNSDYEFMIRDVQIEALVSTENRNGKLSYVIPTSTQLKEIDGNKLQKLKYSLSVVPKTR